MNSFKIFISLLICVIFSNVCMAVESSIVLEDDSASFIQIKSASLLQDQNSYFLSAIKNNETSKNFNKNIKIYKKFIVDNTAIPDSFHARFILPDLEDDIDFKNNKPAKDELLRKIVDNLYLNILKNDSMMLIQKEQITLKKEMLDNARLQGDLKDIMIKNTEYIEAQNEYLEYKKAYASCINQLKILTILDYEPIKKLEDFDAQIFYELKASEFLKNNEKDKLFDLKQKYVVFQNSSKKLEEHLLNANSLEKKDDACDLKKHKELYRAEVLNLCL